MNQIATNIEQSKELLKEGISPETADMMWTVKKEVFSSKGHTKEWHLEVRKETTCETVPAWSLSALWMLVDKPLVFTTVEDTPEKVIQFIVDAITLPF